MIPDKRIAPLSLALLCTGLLCCNRTDSLSHSSSASSSAGLPSSPVAEVAPPVVLHSPMSLTELPTTDGQIATGNLTGSLSAAEDFVKVRPEDPLVLTRAVSLLCAEAQYLGVLADYDRAERHVEQMFKSAPKSPISFMARAKLRSIFHEFEPALADLAQGVKLDPDNAVPASTSRATILAALGRTDEALAILHDYNAIRSDISMMGVEAGLLAERGEIAAADDLYMRAQLKFADVSPFPVAWLYFQQGLMWERADNLPRARELYTAAVTRLPSYAPAVAHLAAAEAARANRDQAITLLRTLIETADDPEYKGQLAGLLKEAGDTKGADALRAQARTQYESLLAKHPRAFASHAVRFYLGAGADAKAALTWAEKNLAALTTTDSISLATEAATAAGAGPRACVLADQLTKRPYVSPRTHVIASRAFSACGQRDRAAAEVAAAAKSPSK